MSPRNGRTDALQVLGLAHRAGSVIRGTDAVRRALREGRAALVILAADAAPGQRRKLDGLLDARGVEARVLGRRDELGAALGSAPLSAVAVTDAGWADRLLEGPAAEAEPT